MTAKAIDTGQSIEHTPSADVAPGEVVVAGTLVGVAPTKIQADSTGDLYVQGKFQMPAKSTDTWGVGASVYWDAAEGELTSTSEDNTLAGRAAVAKTNGQTTNEILLNR